MSRFGTRKKGLEIALHKHAAEKVVKEHLDELNSNLKDIVDGMAETIELKGHCAPGRHQRVAKWATAMAKELGLTEVQMRGIEIAASVYDIGLVRVPAQFLRDVDRLEGATLAVYRQYPAIGHAIFAKMALPWPIAEIILQHREHYDGSGFPKGLKAEAILVEARILALAGAIEDLTVHNNYREALPLDSALEEIAAHSGSRYDPEVVAACLRLFRDKGYKLPD